MADPFLAEIIMFGGNFAPRGWSLCNGQLLSISQYSALFSLLGTTFGGDGRTTFGLPEMRRRVSIHPGSGPGLSTYSLGQKGGVETVTLTTNQMPSHNHPLANNVIEGAANTSDPGGNALAEVPLYRSGTPDARTLPNATTNVGGGQAQTNIQPYLCVNYIIALSGVYPSRN